jgi:hypothetical protein
MGDPFRCRQHSDPLRGRGEMGQVDQVIVHVTTPQ